MHVSSLSDHHCPRHRYQSLGFKTCLALDVNLSLQILISAACIYLTVPVSIQRTDILEMHAQKLKSRLSLFCRAERPIKLDLWCKSDEDTRKKSFVNWRPRREYTRKRIKIWSAVTQTLIVSCCCWYIAHDSRNRAASRPCYISYTKIWPTSRKFTNYPTSLENSSLVYPWFVAYIGPSK